MTSAILSAHVSRTAAQWGCADDKRSWRRSIVLLATGFVVGTLMLAVIKANASADDETAVAALDTRYQAAVRENDAVTMGRLLADDFVLVTGSGKTFRKSDLLNEARSGHYVYERQGDSSQKVRVWGNTAVITARLWAKGTESGKPFEYTLWFSDTYVRTNAGWQYVFGQASLPLNALR